MNKVVEMGRKGFTLIEVIVVAAIIAILAGILVPMIFNQIDESKKTRAMSDIKSIESAMMTMKKDTGRWPTFTNTAGVCTEDIIGLKSNGNTPTSTVYAVPALTDISAVLRTDNTCYYSNGSYKGPYLPAADADPWGNAYIVHTQGMWDPSNVAYVAGPTWIVSAGPNGVIDSNIAAVADGLDGDDIGKRIR